MPIEIQVRTTLQDLWAQIFENLADQWGRQIRYGGLPDPVDTPASRSDKSGRQITGLRRDILHKLKQLSELISRYEKRVAGLAEIEQKIEEFNSNYIIQIMPAVEAIGKNTPTIEIMPHIRRIYVNLRDIFIAICEMAIRDKRRRSRVIRRNFPSPKRLEIPDLLNAINRTLPQAKSMVVSARLNTARQEDELRSILTDLSRLTKIKGVADVALLDRV